MINITVKEADVLNRFTQGQPLMEIAAALGYHHESVRALFRLLARKGLMQKVGYGKYEPTGAPYEIVKYNKTVPYPKSKRVECIKVHPEVLEYIRGHYPYFRNRRGILAKRLGISRTLLNQIAIDYKLAREA